MAKRNKHSRKRYHQLVDACRNMNDSSNWRKDNKKRYRKIQRCKGKQLLHKLRKDPKADIDWTVYDKPFKFISKGRTSSWVLATRQVRCAPKLRDGELSRLPDWIRADYWIQVNREHERSLDPDRYCWYFRHKD